MGACVSPNLSHSALTCSADSWRERRLPINHMLWGKVEVATEYTVLWVLCDKACWSCASSVAFALPTLLDYLIDGKWNLAKLTSSQVFGCLASTVLYTQTKFKQDRWDLMKPESNSWLLCCKLAFWYEFWPPTKKTMNRISCRASERENEIGSDLGKQDSWINSIKFKRGNLKFSAQLNWLSNVALGLTRCQVMIKSTI